MGRKQKITKETTFSAGRARFCYRTNGAFFGVQLYHLSQYSRFPSMTSSQGDYEEAMMAFARIPPRFVRLFRPLSFKRQDDFMREISNADRQARCLLFLSSFCRPPRRFEFERGVCLLGHSVPHLNGEVDTGQLEWRRGGAVRWVAK